MSNYKNFFIQFARPEFKSIAGAYYRNLLIVALIFFLSLLTIGLSQGVSLYLRAKMDSPFVRFLSVRIPSNISDKIKIDDFKAEKLTQQYQYESVEPIYFKYFDFQADDNKLKSVKTRKIRTQSSFYNFISGDPKVFISDHALNSFHNNDWSVIVSQSYLYELGFDMERIPPFINLHTRYKHAIPIRLAGIVSQLPDYVNMLIPPKLYYANDDALDIEAFTHTNYLRFYVPDSLTHLITQYEGFRPLTSADMSFPDAEVYEKLGINNIEEELKVMQPYIEKGFIRLFDLDRSFPGFDAKPYVDFLSFSFKNMDSIYSFQSFLKEDYGIDIEMNEIENKKNFELFNNMSILLSWALILFSIFIVMLFVTNVTLNHIEKNKKNLGTLKAFGLPNQLLIGIYSFISTLMILSAFVLAYTASFMIGDSIIKVLIHFMDIKVASNEIEFTQYALWLLIMFFIVLPITYIYGRLYWAVRKKTPGDLIFERI